MYIYVIIVKIDAPYLIISLICLSHSFRYQSLRRTIRGQRRAGESNRPTILPQDNRQAENEPNRDRPRHLNRRQTAETSVAAAAAAAAVAKPKPESTPDASATDGPAAKSQTPSSARTPTKGSFEDTPGCKFIRRRDFFQFVNNHGVRPPRIYQFFYALIS